jgi:hypothetical protein
MHNPNPIKCIFKTPNYGTINKINPFDNLLNPSITAITADFAFGLFLIYGFSLNTNGMAVLIKL